MSLAQHIRVIRLSDGVCISLPTDSNFVIALGNFDGVHLAHRSLLNLAAQMALCHPPCHSAVFCFDPPSSDFFPSGGRGHLSTLEEKLAMFAECGIEFAFVADFAALRDTEAATFIQDVLKDTCHATAIVCGFNFRFGKDGMGQPDMLERFFGRDNFKMLPPYKLSDAEGLSHTLVSSSEIRAALMQGDVAKAQLMLGRPYQLTAPVVRGKQLGRTLGIPTINQFAPPNKLLPASGIYVTRVCINGAEYRGVSNIGVHPTVDADAALNCETHIIGYSGNAYGQSVTIEFLERLRDEQRFSSSDVLRQAISEDIHHAIEYFDRHSKD